MKADKIAKADALIRPSIVSWTPDQAIQIYSPGRKYFISKLSEEENIEPREVPKHLSRTLWGIEFRSPIMNAAGMFKNGECYHVVANQGAGGYVFGTTTATSWEGNEKYGIKNPFMPYPRSHAAQNWLGLPNEGHEAVAKRVSKINKIPGCPIGASVMGSPNQGGQEKLDGIVHGMQLYDDAGVDFIELNESCPNTPHSAEEFAERIAYISRKFLAKRSRRLPVWMKLSNDTPVDKMQIILYNIVVNGYDGVIFGNTSTDYRTLRAMIDILELAAYDQFCEKFQGGVSGRPLKDKSLMLSRLAKLYIDDGQINPSQEFHVIRTGGIETADDIKESEKAGIELNQWFTAYFENFAQHGHDVYAELYKSL